MEDEEKKDTKEENIKETAKERGADTLSGRGTLSPERSKKKTSQKVWLSLLAVLIAVLLFLGGGAVGYFSSDPATRSFRWLRDTVLSQYYKEISDQEFLDAVLGGKLFASDGSGLLDVYSQYYTAEEYAAQKQEQAGSYSGMGISFITSGGVSRFYRILGNSPAEKSGLVAGMYMVGYGPTADEEDMVFGGYSAEFVSFVAGYENDETFYLWAAEAADGEGEPYAVYKAVYRENYVFYADSDAGYRFVGEDASMPETYQTPYPDLPSDTAVVRLDSFAGDAATQFRNALSILKERGRTRLILDLRNDGGGRMDVLCEIASYLCKDAPKKNFSVSVASYRSGKKEYFTASNNLYNDYLEGISVSVLANRNTASASEALIGAMLDYGTMSASDIYLAEIGGVSGSYGKGIMQTTFENGLTGEAVKLTTATICWPVSGTEIHGVGITPALGAIAVQATGDIDLRDEMLRNVLSAYF